MRRAARRALSRYPAIYLPIARRKYPDAVLGRDTHVVIDGFPRSAVTFAVVAFQFAQNDHVHVAHHIHASSHLIAAARRGVPALVPVREPEDTILSLLVREQAVKPEGTLKSYTDFYERLLPHRSAFVVARFEDVTSDFGGVIRRVNRRFGTSFREFEHTGPNVEACFELIEERARRPQWEPLLGRFLSGTMSTDEYRHATTDLRGPGAGTNDVPEHRVSRPSKERLETKAAIREAFLRPELAPLRERAEKAYERLTREPAEEVGH